MTATPRGAAGPPGPGPSGAPGPPDAVGADAATGPGGPSLGERARRLVGPGGTGALATLSARHSGHPFASLMPYAADARGQPLVLISGLAVHTRNLDADPRASLLVADPDPGGDPLAAGRVTLIGTARRLDPAGVGPARELYLARHPQAAAWVDLADFAFWRLEVTGVYMVGGFGVMGWVAPEAYAGAAPA